MMSMHYQDGASLVRVLAGFGRTSFPFVSNPLFTSFKLLPSRYESGGSSEASPESLGGIPPWKGDSKRKKKGQLTKQRSVYSRRTEPPFAGPSARLFADWQLNHIINLRNWEHYHDHTLANYLIRSPRAPIFLPGRPGKLDSLCMLGPATNHSHTGKYQRIQHHPIVDIRIGHHCK
jgi:hypothetical protein